MGNSDPEFCKELCKSTFRDEKLHIKSGMVVLS